MLTLAEIQTLFERLGTPQAGQDLVMRARREAPVREVRFNGGNVCHRYPSRKMEGRVIVTESRSAEFRACLQYEYDPNLLEYYPQPVELDLWLHKEDPSRRSRVSHTPDFLLIQSDGICLVEWKQERRLQKNAEKYPDRYRSEASGWRSPLLEDYLRDLGISYQLRSAEEHPATFVQNLQFLASYLDADCPPISDRARGSLEVQFDGRAMVPLLELVEAARTDDSQPFQDGYTTDDLYKAIAGREVVFDWYEDDLGDTLRTYIYRDLPALNFHRAVMTSGQQEFPDNIATAIEVGARVDYDGFTYLISMVGKEKVVLQRGGDYTEIPVQLVEQFHLDRRLTIHPVQKKGMELAVRLNALSPRAIQDAVQRAEWVELAKTCPESVPRSKRTLQRYRKKMWTAGEVLIDQRLALASQYGNCGVSTRRIPEDVLKAIERTVQEKYNKEANPSKAAAYLYFKAECANQVLTPCSYKTFLKKMRPYTSDLKRLGRKGAYQLKPIVYYLDREDPIHGARPWQYVHVDGTELEIFARGLKSMKKLGKVWLTMAMDAESRAILGFVVSFEKAGYRSVMMLLRDLVRRHNRLPEYLILDNGPEHHAHALKRFARIYGITIVYRPKGEPRFGTVIERGFGTVHTEFIRLLEGNTQLLKNPRSVSLAVQPERFVRWTLVSLHGALDCFFTDRYGKDPHPAHRDLDYPGPVEHLHHRLEETGQRRHRLIRYDQQLLIESCPGPVDGDSRVVDNLRGIKVMNLYYQSEAFHSPGMMGKKVEVRIDPWDPRFVYALVNGHWERCVSIEAMRLRKYTARERRYASERVRERGQKTWRDSEEDLIEFMNAMDPANFDPLLAEQQAEAVRLYAPLKMTDVGCLDESPEPTAEGIPMLVGCQSSEDAGDPIPELTTAVEPTSALKVEAIGVRENKEGFGGYPLLG